MSGGKHIKISCAALALLVFACAEDGGQSPSDPNDMGQDFVLEDQVSLEDDELSQGADLSDQREDVHHSGDLGHLDSETFPLDITGEAGLDVSGEDSAHWLPESPIRITEFSASNDGGYVDFSGETPDWIELYNASSEPVELDQYALTDDPEETPWTLPSIVLEPYSYILILASGNEFWMDGSEINAPFQLSANGEYLALLNNAGEVVQSFGDTYPAQMEGVSYGEPAVILVGEGVMVNYMVPVDGSLGNSWQGSPGEDSFDDSEAAGWFVGSGSVAADGAVVASPLDYLAEDIVSYWSFDSQEDGQVADHIDESHVGILEADASLTTGGMGRDGVGEALSGDVGGWMSVSNPEGYDFDSDFTWSVWLKGTDNSGALLSRNPAGGEWNMGSRALFVRSGTVQWDSGWVGNPQTGANVTDNTWHHVAVSYVSDSDMLSIYVDGMMHYNERFDVNIYPESNSSFGGTANTGLFVGESNPPSTLENLDKYSGLIDDLAIYSAALAEEDIQLLADGETPVGGGFSSWADTVLPGESSAVYIRVPFEVSDVAELDTLILRMGYDDGFIAYLNGVEVARANVTEPITWESRADTDRPDEMAVEPEDYHISQHLDLLQTGENILAIHVMASEEEESGLYVQPQLWAYDAEESSYLSEETPLAPNSVGVAPPEGCGELPSDGVIINEFMSDNLNTLLDEDGEPSDWIELYNGSDEDVSLAGWSLSDVEGMTSRWRFPDITIEAGEYLVVFASGKDRSPIDGGELHTNFRLDNDGEYLGLFSGEASGLTASEFAPEYGPQETDVSTGRHGEPGLWHLPTPTPGDDNLAGSAGAAAPGIIQISMPGGLYQGSHTVEIYATCWMGTLRCTTDGTLPSMTSEACPETVELSGVTQIRAAIFGAAGETDAAISRTYLPVEDDLAAFTSNIPIAVFETYGQSGILNNGCPRQYYPVEAAFYQVDEESGRAALSDPAHFAGRSAMHIRGNSTASYEKRQYRLEIWDETDRDRPVPLLGMPSEGDWVLHAPYSDKSLMRNHLMYQWSNDIGRYAVRSEYFEAFIDWDEDGIGWDDYEGVYVLMEKIEQGEDRVNVADLDETMSEEPDISGGYLLKKDWGDCEEGFETSRYRDFLIYEYPNPADLTGEQEDYLQRHFNQFEAVLAGGDFADPDVGYAQYVDVLSFIDHHLMVEMGRNVDGFVLSTYLHKDREGLITMGPIWDYNGGLGGADYFQAYRTAGWHTENPEFPADNPNAYEWYERMFDDLAFRQLYAERWMELREGPWATDVMVADINDTAERLTEAAARNFDRWDILGDYIWPNAPGYNTRNTFQKEVDYLAEWLTGRLLWMDSELEDGEY